MTDRPDYLRDSDAFSWYMERDPLLRSTIVSVVVLDEVPDLERLLDRAGYATRRSPGFRHRIVETPWRLANPRWVADPDFDLAYHQRHISLPPPGTLAQVFAYACQTGMAGFDTARPLWEFTLVEGLEGGRCALVMKLHHALTDGIGGMEMAQYLFDLEPDAPPPDDDPPTPRGEHVSAASLVRDALRHDARRVIGAVGEQLRRLPADTWHAARDPRGALGDAIDMARSVVRTARPVTTTLSPVMQDRRLAWHYDALVLPLDALRDAAHASDVTVNDAFLGGLTGGLARYHEQCGRPVDELRVTMPISIRSDDDPIGGNRITLMRLVLPVGVRDPRVRMRRIHEACIAARNEPAIPHTNAIAAALNLLPRGYVGGMLKHVDFLASNVPGIAVPVYLAGARVAEWYAFGPTIGAALNATLVSYAGTCTVGCNLDPGAVPEVDRLVDGLREGFTEVVALGGSGTGDVRLPLRAAEAVTPQA